MIFLSEGIPCLPSATRGIMSMVMTWDSKIPINDRADFDFACFVPDDVHYNIVGAKSMLPSKDLNLFLLRSKFRSRPRSDTTNRLTVLVFELDL